MRASILFLLLPALALATQLRLRQSLSKRNVDHLADHTVQLMNYMNVQYSGPITIGGQTLPVIYDTGSFEILVMSTLCTSCAEGLAKYDSSQSSTFMSAGGIRAEHVFGSGPVRSEKGYDAVRLGNAQSPYYVQRVPFWQIVDHDIAAWTDEAAFSGIVGMPYLDSAPEGFGEQNAVKEQLMLAALKVDSFAFCLGRSTEEAPGILAVGPNIHLLPHVASGFRTMPVVGQVHWGVSLTNVWSPGVNIPNPCHPSCGAIIDSGTSLIAVPPSAREFVDALKARLNKDCSNVDSMPVLRLQLGGMTVDLPPRAYVMKVAALALRVPMNPQGIWDLLTNLDPTTVVDQCVVAFMEIDKQSQFGPVWILGMPFMRYYYTIFDRHNKKIHIAHSSPTCETPAKTTGFGLVNSSDVNSTHDLGNASAGGGMWSAADYQPTRVDLRSARWPEWAVKNDSAPLKL